MVLNTKRKELSIEVVVNFCELVEIGKIGVF
jgi:hypothetical protein